MTELIAPVFSGLGFGLALAFMMGPVFFALLQTSIEKGFLSGLIFALGVVLSDCLYFLLAYFGLSRLSEESTGSFQEIMGLVGGAIIIFFGIGLLRKKPQILRRKSEKSANSLVRSMGKAFFLNALNPFVLIYWIGVVGAIGTQYEFDGKKIFAFFLACMTMVFGTDTLKAYLAYSLKNIITPRFMLWLNRISGSVLVLGGVHLIWSAAKLHFHL